MKEDRWLERYRNSTDHVRESVDVLTGFNSNIDIIHHVDKLDLDLEDTEPELKDVKSLNDLKSSLKYCINEGENHEIDIEADFELDLPGEEKIGGQAGIVSNFLSGIGSGVIFYTPLLSEELAGNLNEKILYPVIDGEFVLKNVRDASNTDRTKRNHIFEFNQEKSGRLILSDSLKGFGPYFRKGVEDNLEKIQEGVDCAIFSGFHDVEGNMEAKLKKSEEQLSKLEIPVHLEYVHKNEKITSLIIEHIASEVDSIGLDETEMKKLLSVMQIEREDEGDLNLGEAFREGKKILEELNLSRLQLHTYRYHLTLTETSYTRSKEKIRDAMLFGEVAAIQTAEKGEIPDKEVITDFNMENKELHPLRELEHFEDFFDLEDFSREGVAEVEDLNVIAIPTIIHQDPKRTVGMGDIISSGAFTSEFR